MDMTTFFDMSYGLFILGALKDGRRVGCTVNTVLQITSTPATLAVSLNLESFTSAVIKETGRLTVNILDETCPMDLIGSFGFRSGRDTDKFAPVAHHLTDRGLPVLDHHVCGYFECRVLSMLELSTHTLFTVEVEDARRVGGGKVAAMTYAYYHLANLI